MPFGKRALCVAVHFLCSVCAPLVFALFIALSSESVVFLKALEGGNVMALKRED